MRPRWNQGRGPGERLASGDQGPELQALVLVNPQPPPTSYSARDVTHPGGSDFGVAPRPPPGFHRCPGLSCLHLPFPTTLLTSSLPGGLRPSPSRSRLDTAGAGGHRGGGPTGRAQGGQRTLGCRLPTPDPQGLQGPSWCRWPPPNPPSSPGLVSFSEPGLPRSPGSTGVPASLTGTAPSPSPPAPGGTGRPQMPAAAQ